MNRRVRVEGLTQATLAQDLADRRTVTNMTEPLLSIAEAQAEVTVEEVGPLAGESIPKADAVVPEAQEVV